MIAAMPKPSRRLIGSSNSHPPSIGVIAKASATKGYARDNGVKVRIQTQQMASAQ
jgi:hypothetical protein